MMATELVPRDMTESEDGFLQLTEAEVDCGEIEEEEEACLEGDLSADNTYQCSLCEERFKLPRILSCLHTFCTACLEAKLEPLFSPASAQQALSQALNPGCAGTITCPKCDQVTRVGPRGVSELATDYVLINLIDMADIEEQQIVCTSCKAQEKAVARCSDCANFLCPNCVTAHQFMRCFENHKVVSFEELRGQDGVSIHKPIFCSAHENENVKYFCNTCQIPICNECMMGEHQQPSHSYERIADLGQTEHLKSLVTEARSKVEQCEEASSKLEGALSELQMQQDNARGLIEETFQSYKAIFEKRKDELLSELDDIHKAKELQIMDLFETVGKTTAKIDDSCQFTERVLKHGNSTEVLLVKRVVESQLLALVKNTPNLDVSVKIDFHSDAQKFENAVNETFGSFEQPQDFSKESPVPCVQPAFDGDAFTLQSAILSEAASMLSSDLIPAMAHLPPLPTLAQPDSTMRTPTDLSALPRDLAASSDIAGVSTHTINSIATSLQNLPMVGTGPTLSGVPAQVERSSSRNSYSPAMSDSGISVDAASTSSGPGAGQVVTTSFGTAGVLSQRGVTVNAAGNVVMNGQMLPLNLNTGALPRANNPTTPTPDQNFASLLGSMSAPAGGVPQVSRSQTPQQLTDIATLLSQTSPTTALSGLSALTPAGHPITGGASGMMSPQDEPVLGGMMPSNAHRVNLQHGFSGPLPSARGGTKMSAMQIRCKFGQLGPGKGQFNSPHGFCLGMDEDIVVADTNNHRIQVFEKTGEFKYQFGIPGREEGQLWYPRKVAVMRNSGKYVVCDRGNERSRMQIFTKNGHFIKKISIRYIDIVAGLAITQQGHIVAVDSVSPTVFCIAETGELVKWFDCSDYMREPSDIAISGKEYFVCDFKGHCVVVFNEDGQFARRIGCENITNYPNGIDISDAGDILIGDSHGNRFHVAVFQREGSLIGEFECPYVKVSRCCGLKITLEGYVVTLAKNNHHVLVLNTLYIA